MKTQVLYGPNIVMQLTGVMVVEKTKTHCTLVYTDATREACKLSDLPKSLDWESMFSIVSAVQALRNKP